MKTKLKNALDRMRYYGQFFPLSPRAFWIGLGLILFYHSLWPRVPAMEQRTPDQQLLWLMIRMAAGFALALALVSLISTLITWSYYLRHIRKGNPIWSIHPGEDSQNPSSLQLILHRQCRPLLGSLRARWNYDCFQLSPWFTVVGLQAPNPGKKNGRIRLATVPPLEWPDIREYHLHSAILQIQDMFRILSLPLKLDFRQSYIPPPPHWSSSIHPPAPRLQEESEQRIPWIRKSRGDYIQHKDFEAGDDIRRIAWKWYARNRELLVRIPEIQEPYASELFIYASFYVDPGSLLLPEDYRLEMLNFYKSQIWAIVQGIQKNHPATHFVSDQAMDAHGGPQDRPMAWTQIAQARWQGETPPSEIPDLKKNASLVLVSSLTRPEDMEDLIERLDRSQELILIPLSHSFPRARPWTRWKSLIFRPPSDRWSRLNARWWYSPWRRRLKKREKQWAQLLESYGRDSSLQPGIQNAGLVHPEYRP